MTEWSFQAIHDALLSPGRGPGSEKRPDQWPVRVAVRQSHHPPAARVELCHILGKEGPCAGSSRASGS